MWQIFEKRSVARVLRKAPPQVRVRYEAWKRICELEGPCGLRSIKGFHDEVIYEVERDSLVVYVIEVNPHDY